MKNAVPDFQREARAIAALNHSNIVHIYSVEEFDGVHFITMELVDGKTLDELLPGKGFPIDKFLDIAIPLADAVAAAHGQGIVHRDLKPGNVMVSVDGRVKVLDLGLAHTEAPLQMTSDSESPTELKTRDGVLLGTLHYMSPEQVEGKTIDVRSDTFSLGIVFYEMLCGRRPFEGDTLPSTLSAILKDDPLPVPPSVPRDVARIVRKCLVKDPERRYQSSKDVRLDLEEVRHELDSGALEPTPGATPPLGWRSPRWRRRSARLRIRGVLAAARYRCGSGSRYSPAREPDPNHVRGGCRGLPELVTRRTHVGVRVEPNRQQGHLGRAGRYR